MASALIKIYHLRNSAFLNSCRARGGGGRGTDGNNQDDFRFISDNILSFHSTGTFVRMTLIEM